MRAGRLRDFTFVHADEVPRSWVGPPGGSRYHAAGGGAEGLHTTVRDFFAARLERPSHHGEFNSAGDVIRLHLSRLTYFES